MSDECASATEIQVEYKACRVCGDEPRQTIPPKYVYSLDEDDRDEETVRALPFGGSLSVPFACSDECFNDYVGQNPEVA